jgi:hypothetical protein
MMKQGENESLSIHSRRCLRTPAANERRNNHPDTKKKETSKSIITVV